jgi:putative tryptophan/tyrosine transport system permease protein
MGQPNVSLLGQATLFNPNPEALSARSLWAITVSLLVIIVIVKLLLDWLFHTEWGLTLRATGSNPEMAKAQGINTDRMILAGMALSNGLIALAGGLFAQVNGFADISMGSGTIIFGLAAVVIGETLLSRRSLAIALWGAILGSILYRIVVAVALNTKILGLQSQDLNLVTAVLVGIALVLPNLRGGRKVAR